MAVLIGEFTAGISAGAAPQQAALGSDGNVWFTEFVGTVDVTGFIAKITPTGTVTEFSSGTDDGGHPLGICAGPDGNLWYTFLNRSRVSRITTTGTVTEFPTGGIFGFYICAGPDGNLWFTSNAVEIHRMTTAGVVTTFTTGITGAVRGICAGPDGNLWFTESSSDRVGKITTAGVVTEFSTGITAGAFPYLICAGPDGNLWFTESVGNRVAKITTTGTVTEYSVGSGRNPNEICVGPDGNIWFVEFNLDQIGRITPDGAISEFGGITPNAAINGICAGADGNIWFAETADRIGRIDLNAPQFNPPVKGNGRIIAIALDSMGGRGTKKITPTIAAGDFKIDIDGSGFTNLALLPIVNPNGSCRVRLHLRAAEMNGDVITIKGVDQTSPKEWADYFQCIPTSA